jgi:lysophospholipase
MQQVALPDCPPPHFALAHSTGGLICLRAARDGRTRFTRMVLDGPLLGLGSNQPSQGFAHSLMAIMTAIGLGELDLPSRRATTIERMQFENNPLTSDPARFQRNVEIAQKIPRVTVGVPTYGWLYAACRAMAEASDGGFAPAINVPILMVAGSLDRVVSVQAIEALAGELRAGSLVILPGARHDILMERNLLREQYWAAFDAFIPGS